MTTVDVVIPVHDEEHVLAQSIAPFGESLPERFPHRCTVVFANSASADRTRGIAEVLPHE